MKTVNGDFNGLVNFVTSKNGKELICNTEGSVIDGQNFHVKYLQSGYESILENLKKDEAGFASTQLHYTRDRFNDLKGIQNYLVNHSLISIDENRSFQDIRKEIAEIIQNRLQERLLWLARGINESIEIRKQKGRYNGEFDTATILANAFNDILGREYGKIFDGHPGNE